MVFIVLCNGMDKEELAVLKHMSNTLDKILEALSEPQNKVVQVFNIGATIVGILGMLAIIDVILSWIKG
jgi:energy-converting hydrogenase Eha subunit F